MNETIKKQGDDFLVEYKQEKNEIPDIRFWHKNGLKSYFELPEEFQLEVGIYKSKTLITKDQFIRTLQVLISNHNQSNNEAR